MKTLSKIISYIGLSFLGLGLISYVISPIFKLDTNATQVVIMIGTLILIMGIILIGTAAIINSMTKKELDDNQE